MHDGARSRHDLTNTAQHRPWFKIVGGGHLHMRNQRGCRAVRLLRDDRAVAYGDRARHGFALEVRHLDPAVSQLGGHFVSGLRAGTRNRRDGGRCSPGHAGGRVTSPSTRPARGPKKAAKADAMCHEVARRGLGDRLGAALQTNPLRSGRGLDAMTDAGSPVRLVRAPISGAPPGALAFGEDLQLGSRLAGRVVVSCDP
jgi:hypothetical protein